MVGCVMLLLLSGDARAQQCERDGYVRGGNCPTAEKDSYGCCPSDALREQWAEAARQQALRRRAAQQEAERLAAERRMACALFDPELERTVLHGLSVAEAQQQLSALGADRKVELSQTQVCSIDLQAVIRSARNLDLRVHSKDFDGTVTAQCLPVLNDNLCALELPTQTTNAGVSHLSALRNLTALELRYSSVSDDGLSHLSGLTNLTVLDLTGTSMSDAGLSHLSGLTNLTFLGLSGTQVSDAGVAQLQAALPNCYITH